MTRDAGFKSASRRVWLPALGHQRVVEQDADGLVCLEAIRDLVEPAADHRLEQLHRPGPVECRASSRISRGAGDR
jgi:hypothetical protein